MDQQLWEKLREIMMEATGIPNCYYDPPENIQMKYPCIVFHLSGDDCLYADNKTYFHTFRWTATIMDRYSTTQERYIREMEEKCRASLDRMFVNDGIHHTVFTINYRGGNLQWQD